MGKRSIIETKIFKPAFDKLFYIIWIPTSALMLAATAISAFSLGAFLIMLSVDIFTFYFLFTSIFSYVELREHTLFIKFGFIIKREIPYRNIRGLKKERRAYSETMLSLKNAMEHVVIKYNSFDVVTVSVVGNDELIEEIEARRENENKS